MEAEKENEFKHLDIIRSNNTPDEATSEWKADKRSEAV